MYEMEWIVGIYRFFFYSQTSCWKLILAVGSKFGSNPTIKSSYSHWKHFLVVGSSQI